MPLEAIKENVGNLLQSDGIQNLKTQAGEFAQSDKLKSLLPYLLSGGAGAVAGGMVTGRQRADKGESRSGYMGRVLRNALAAGGLAAGGHALINKGLDSTVGGFKAAEGTSRVEGPLETATKNIAFSPLTAAGAGGAALLATHKRPFIGAPSTDGHLAKFKYHHAVDTDLPVLRASSAREIGDLERAAGPGYDAKTRRMAGLSSDVMTDSQRKLLDKYLPQKLLDKLSPKGLADREAQLRAVKGNLSAVLRKGPMSTFGQSNLSRAGRGSIGLAAASIPALLGAFTPE